MTLAFTIALDFILGTIGLHKFDHKNETKRSKVFWLAWNSQMSNVGCVAGAIAPLYRIQVKTFGMSLMRRGRATWRLDRRGATLFKAMGYDYAALILLNGTKLTNVCEFQSIESLSHYQRTDLRAVIRYKHWTLWYEDRSSHAPPRLPPSLPKSGTVCGQYNFYVKLNDKTNLVASRPPPPPLRGRRDRMRVPKISGKGRYFSCDKVRPENCKKKKKKKGGYLTFHPEISLQKGGGGGSFSLSRSLFGRLRNLKRGL